MPSGGVEGLQGAQEIPAAALLGRRYPEELEELSAPPQAMGSYNHSEGVARVQREEAIRQDAESGDAAAGRLQRLPGSAQVRCFLCSSVF